MANESKNATNHLARSIARESRKSRSIEALVIVLVVIPAAVIVGWWFLKH
ncbi:MAG: hypothetical protein ACKVW3_13005 [Phycisphaerales bacterium]